jgi:hypothetical protein
LNNLKSTVLEYGAKSTTNVNVPILLELTVIPWIVWGIVAVNSGSNTTKCGKSPGVWIFPEGLRCIQNTLKTECPKK